MLRCEGPDETGSVRADGTFNFCAQLTNVAISAPTNPIPKCTPTSSTSTAFGSHFLVQGHCLESARTVCSAHRPRGHRSKAVRRTPWPCLPASSPGVPRKSSTRRSRLLVGCALHVLIFGYSEGLEDLGIFGGVLGWTLVAASAGAVGALGEMSLAGSIVVGDCGFLGLPPVVTNTIEGVPVNADFESTCFGSLVVSEEELDAIPLQNNGGPTDTRGLGAGSVAIDQLPEADPLTRTGSH